MKHLLLPTIGLLLVGQPVFSQITANPTPPQAKWLLWYHQPAKNWNEALPLGNGHLGAMVYGTIPNERIQFNEYTVWTGHPRSYANPGAVEHLPEIRRLLIGSSRAGGHPATLQGIWNDSLKPAWDSKYTCNINTQMNYWPAELANLSECADPLFDALGELMISGRETAKEHYAAPGWVLHHNFDLWRDSAPINASNHGIGPTGGAWLCHHLWERFLFTGDQQFLREKAYPILRNSAEFFASHLIEDPVTQTLISGPSNSPEQGGLVMGPTMDPPWTTRSSARCSRSPPKPRGSSRPTRTSPPNSRK